MFRIFIALFLFAQPADAETYPDPWPLAHDGDVQALETSFAKAHQDMLKGDLTADDLRAQVSALLVTHPDVLAGTQSWLDAYPHSPYANIVRAWQLSESGWFIRRGHSFLGTHPNAIAAFREQHNRAMDIALVVYANHPDYIPASDAMIKLSMTTARLSDKQVDDILNDVMLRQPNHGTLARAALLTGRNWGGGGLPQLAQLCDDFAALVPEYENYTPELCVAELTFNMTNDEDAEQMMAWSPALRASKDFEDARIAALIISDPTPQEVSEITRYFQGLRQPTANQVIRMKTFTLAHTPANAFEVVTNQVYTAAVSTAISNLERDPYNARSIETIRRYIGGTNIRKFDARPSDDTDFEARILMVSPYSPNSWLLLSRDIPKLNGIPDFTRQKAFIGNAIVTAQYDPQVLRRVQFGYLSDLMKVYARRDVGAITADVSDAIREDVFCSVRRIEQLRNFMCGNGYGAGTRACSDAPDRLNSRAPLVSEVLESGICEEIDDAAIDDLAYEFQDVDLSGFIQLGRALP